MKRHQTTSGVTTSLGHPASSVLTLWPCVNSAFYIGFKTHQHLDLSVSSQQSCWTRVVHIEDEETKVEC